MNPRFSCQSESEPPASEQATAAARPLFGDTQEGWRLLRDSRVPLWMKAAPALLVFGYCVLPFDLIPDPILALGQVDDLGIVAAGMLWFRSAAIRYVSGVDRVGTNERLASDPALCPVSAGNTEDEGFRSNLPALPPARRQPDRFGLSSLAAVLIVVLLAAVVTAKLVFAMQSPPSSPPPPPTVVLGLLRQEKLHLLEYRTQKVLEEHWDNCVFGPERMLYVAQGGATIGVDLQTLTEEDVQTGDGERSIVVRLPEARALSTFVSVDDSYVFDHRTASPVCPDHKLEMLAAAQARVESEIAFSGETTYLVHTAEQNGIEFVTLFLKKLGYTRVYVSIRANETGVTPTAPAPTSTQVLSSSDPIETAGPGPTVEPALSTPTM